MPLFAPHAVAPKNRDGLQLRVLVGLSAAAALAFSLLGWVTMTATMTGNPLGGVDRDDLMAMIAMPGLGTSWLLRIASLVLLVIAASIAVFGRTLPVMGTMLGAIALGSLAWAGHGAAGDGMVGQFHLGADVVHLLAAGAWIGALIALSLLLWRASRDAEVVNIAHRGLASFGRTGTMIVTAIVGTGLINSWTLIGGTRIVDLPATLWGRLLLAKLALFAAMLVLAALNRWVLTPTLNCAPPTPALAMLGQREACGTRPLTWFRTGRSRPSPLRVRHTRPEGGSQARNASANPHSWSRLP